MKKRQTGTGIILALFLKRCEVDERIWGIFGLFSFIKTHSGTIFGLP